MFLLTKLKSFGIGTKTVLNLVHTQKTLFCFAASFTDSCYLPLSAATEECVPTFRLIQLMLRVPFLIPGQQQQLDFVQISLQEANATKPYSAAGLIHLGEPHNIHIIHKTSYTQRITRLPVLLTSRSVLTVFFKRRSQLLRLHILDNKCGILAE